MEYLNKIELRGIIGAIRVAEVAGRKLASLSLCTQSITTASEGEKTISCEWHNVDVWESGETPRLEELAKGDAVYLVGRLQNQRVTAEDGQCRYITRIRASLLCKVDSSERLVPSKE